MYRSIQNSQKSQKILLQKNIVVYLGFPLFSEIMTSRNVQKSLEFLEILEKYCCLFRISPFLRNYDLQKYLEITRFPRNPRKILLFIQDFPFFEISQLLEMFRILQKFQQKSCFIQDLLFFVKNCFQIFYRSIRNPRKYCYLSPEGRMRSRPREGP